MVRRAYGGSVAPVGVTMTAALQRTRPAKRRHVRPGLLAWLALAGIVVYVGIDVLLAFLRPGYSLVYNAESDYGRGSWFWVMDANFLLRCALSLALVAALAQVIRPGPGARSGLALLAGWALCSGLLAFFADDLEGQPAHGSGTVHLALAFIAFTCVTVGTIVLSATFRSDGARGRVGALLLPVSLSGAVAYALLGAVLRHQHAPIGLYERIFLGIELLWIALAAGCIAAEPNRRPARPPVP